MEWFQDKISMEMRGYMGSIKINDEEMYQYFEKLFYGEKSALKASWRKQPLWEEQGLTNSDVQAMFGSKRLLYGERDAKRQLCLMEGLQKFLHEYVGIEGLEQLLINNYGTIENSIFFEHDERGNPVHIREHAKHQMKNAYLGSRLLLDGGYLEDMAQKIYLAESPVTDYLVQQAAIVAFNLDDDRLTGEKLIAKTADTANRKKVLDKLKEWSYKCFMISSMLHDIGYPLEYYLRSAAQLTEYPPYLKLLAPTVKTDYAQIRSCLLESQLFRLVNQEEIQEKYQKNNHGVLSAVSLLMSFYHNGRIYSLSREKRCLIEMSAIAIYRHTDKFKSGFRMVYRRDPISFMVRLCDDLQEWQRFKIIINDKHNYLQCTECGALLQEENKTYCCPCCGNAYEKVTQIESRKANYVCLCDELVLETSKKKTKVHVIFHLMKQFEILLEDYTAVLRRAEDLEKVAQLLSEQALQPELEISYFLSNNPYLLIEQMIQGSDRQLSEVQCFIDQLENEKKRENMNRFFQDYLANRKRNPFGGKLEKNRLKYEARVQEYARKHYGEVCCLYRYLFHSR